MRRLSIIMVLIISFVKISAQEQSDSLFSFPNLNLDEVVVKGKHSLAKVEGNTVVYKPKVLLERYAPTTAYDLLMKVPSVTGSGDAISLIGANNLMVVIDGKITTMEQEQVFQQLKALAPDKVKNIEIYYNAPAKYHFNGAVINITTTFGSLSEYSVFLDATAKQTRKTSTDDRASLLWSNKGITSLTSVGYIYDSQWSNTKYRLYPDNTFTNPYRERDAINRLYGNKYHVSEDLTFQFSPDYRLTIDYYGMFNNDNSITNTNIWQQTAQNMKALSKEYTKETLHTAGIQVDLKMIGRWEYVINHIHRHSRNVIYQVKKRKNLYCQTIICNSLIKM